jgi:hypothetical protein
MRMPPREASAPAAPSPCMSSRAPYGAGRRQRYKRGDIVPLIAPSPCMSPRAPYSAGRCHHHRNGGARDPEGQAPGRSRTQLVIPERRTAQGDGNTTSGGPPSPSSLPPHACHPERRTVLGDAITTDTEARGIPGASRRNARHKETKNSSDLRSLMQDRGRKAAAPRAGSAIASASTRGCGDDQAAEDSETTLAATSGTDAPRCLPR